MPLQFVLLPVKLLFTTFARDQCSVEEVVFNCSFVYHFIRSIHTSIAVCVVANYPKQDLQSHEVLNQDFVYLLLQIVAILISHNSTKQSRRNIQKEVLLDF